MGQQHFGTFVYSVWRFMFQMVDHFIKHIPFFAIGQATRHPLHCKCIFAEWGDIKPYTGKVGQYAGK